MDEAERPRDLPRGHEDRESDIRAAFARVPSIGEGQRWYDWPYRFLSWLIGSWRRKILPAPLRRRVNWARNFLIPFNEIERARLHRTYISSLNAGPADDRVTLGSTWVIELFPPSRTSDLLRGLRRAGWELDRIYTGLSGDPNAEMVTKSRAGEGWRWWRLGDVARKESTYLMPEAIRSTLPLGFEYVELKAVQLGSSITAVVARFSRTKEGEKALDEVWRHPHGPQLIWRGWKRAHVDDRYFATIRNTLAERKRQQDSARQWLARRLRGYFGEDLAQPVFDLCLLEQHDPLAPAAGQRERKGLRALGLAGHPSFRHTSPQVPHMVLVPHEGHERGYADAALTDCWALVANRARAIEAYADQRQGYGGSRDAEFLSHLADDFVQEFLLMLAVVKYERVTAGKLAALRDDAQQHQGRFSVRKIRRLRSDLLQRSLELTWVARDAKRLWQTGIYGWSPIEINATDIHAGEKTKDLSFNYGKRLKSDLRSRFKTQIEEDNRYRNVLSSASTLGSAVETTRLSRWALVVSLISLFVVILTVLLMDPGENSLWSLISDAF